MADLNIDIMDLAKHMGLRVVQMSPKVEDRSSNTSFAASEVSTSSVSLRVEAAGPNAVRVCIDSESLASQFATATS